MGNSLSAEDRREVYAIRKNAGLCVVCGVEPAVPGRSCCVRCLKVRNDNVRARRYKRVSKGLCIVCGKNPVKPGLVMCPECIDKRNARRREIYNKRIDAGLCPLCGKKRSEYALLCWNCLRKVHAKRARTKSIHNYKSPRDHEVYMQRKANGICPRCNQPVDDPKFVYCSACRWKKQKYNANCLQNMTPEQIEQKKRERKKRYEKEKRKKRLEKKEAEKGSGG